MPIHRARVVHGQKHLCIHEVALLQCARTAQRVPSTLFQISAQREMTNPNHQDSNRMLQKFVHLLHREIQLTPDPASQQQNLRPLLLTMHRLRQDSEVSGHRPGLSHPQFAQWDYLVFDLQQEENRASFELLQVVSLCSRLHHPSPAIALHTLQRPLHVQ